MRTIAIAAALSAAALLAGACGSEDRDDAPSAPAASTRLDPPLRHLVAAAEREGTLALNWSMSGKGTIEPLIAAFKRTYDLDLEVKLTPTPSFPANLAKLLEEHRAGRRAGTDAYVGTADYIVAGRKIFAPVDWKAVAPHAAEHATRDGVAVPLLHQIPGLAYNTEQIPEDQLPRTVDDVLKLKQPLASTPYAAIFNLLGADELLGRARLERHLRGFDPDGLIGCAELDRLASGEFAALWMSCGSHIVDIAVADGAPLASLVPSDGGVIQPWYMAVPRHAAHPNAAKLWIAWLVTPEAQRILFEHEHADNRNVAGSGTAKQVAAHAAHGVRLTDVGYDFVREHPALSDPRYIGRLAKELR